MNASRTTDKTKPAFAQLAKTCGWRVAGNVRATAITAALLGYATEQHEALPAMLAAAWMLIITSK
jgi:hypothetical protein